jgi:V/A-type H+-transporting ATPase subunit A
MNPPTSQPTSHSRITRVNGPIVEAVGMRGAQMYEVVEVGPRRLIGELIRAVGDLGTMQVYENTSGLRPGQPVYPTGRLLSVNLGPGLLGNIYDGIQRPLREIAERAGAFIPRGEKLPALNTTRQWRFTPTVKEGEEVHAGQIIGTLPETPLIEHRVLVPPGCNGTVRKIVPAGDYTIEQEICVVQTPAGDRTLKLAQEWASRMTRPYREREMATTPLISGLRVIDMFFPIAKGGTAMIPGGFGTGKTMTQHSLAKWCDADIIIYIGCGERGNEMTDVLTSFPELVDPKSGHPLMERTVMIANTSNMPVAAREVSIYTGITLAEYYRDMGYAVGVMADSTSRWAEALRELSGRLEEMPAEEGYPAYLQTRLAQFYERAGSVVALCGRRGSVSIIGAVSPMGGDFSEPVTQHTRRFVRCFWALDTDLAYSRHYPAIHWLKSYSEYVDDVTEWWEEVAPDWRALRAKAIDTLQQEDRLQEIVKLVGPDVLPDSQRLILLIAEILRDGFLQQSAFDDIDMFCDPRKQVRLLKIMIDFLERGNQLIERGATIVQIRALPCIQQMIRAKSTIPNSKPEELDALESLVRSQLDALEKDLK